MRAFSSSSSLTGCARSRSTSATQAAIAASSARSSVSRSIAEAPGIERRVGPRVDAIDEPVALLHRAHQPAALAAAEQERERDRDRARPGGRARRRDRRSRPRRARTAARAARRAARAAAARAARRGARRSARGRAKASAIALEHRARSKLPDRDHDEIVRRVPALVEAAQRARSNDRDALARPEDRRAVGVHAERLVEHRVAEHAAGRVVAAPDLLEHDLDLALDLVRVEDASGAPRRRARRCRSRTRPRAAWRGRRSRRARCRR